MRILRAALSAAFAIGLAASPMAQSAVPAEPTMSSLLADAKAGKVKEVDVSNSTGTATMADGSKVEVGLTLHWRGWVEEMVASGVSVRAVRDPSSQLMLWNGWIALATSLLLFLLLATVLLRLARGTMGNPLKRVYANRHLRRLLGRADEPVVTFADVAGADEAKASLVELVDMLKNPSRFEAIGARWPSGVLLVGDPGNGKTLLAKAVAGEAGVPFHATAGSEFVMMFAGLGARNVRAAFRAARRQRPCILFIDEIDTLGGKRGNGAAFGADKEHEQTLTQLLKEMDGMDTSPGVIVIGATNRPEALDPAILRPGRFDRHITVEAPGSDARADILKIHSAKLKLAGDVDFKKLSKATSGLSGADLAALANEAAVEAASGNAESVAMAHFEGAIDRKRLGGSERKGFVLTQAERRLIAVHEAGHALLSVLQPACDPVHKATIVPRGRALGFVSQLPEEDARLVPKDKMEADLVMSLGGRAAEEVVFGKGKVTSGAQSDIKFATNLARMMVASLGMGSLMLDMTDLSLLSEASRKRLDEEVEEMVRGGYAKALELAKGNREALDAIAEALLERETIDGDEVRAIARRAVN